MTVATRRGTRRALPARPSAQPASATGLALSRVVIALAPAVLAAVIAFPVLIQPMIEPAPPPSAIADAIPAQSDGESSIVTKIYFPLLALLAMAAVFARHGTSVLARLRDPAIVLLGLACGWIVLTSFMAVEPQIALRRSILQITIVVAIAGSILAARSTAALLKAVGMLYAAILVLNLAAVATQQPTYLGYAGLYTHKNQLGAVAVVGVMVGIVWAATAGRWLRVVALLMVPLGIGLIVASRSKTSLAMALAIPMLALLLALGNRLLRISPAITSAALLASLWFVYTFGVAMLFWDFHAVAERLFGDPTITQRTDIWAFALKMIPQRPITGFGYEVFWGAGPESPSLREGPGFVAKMPHAHNGYIDLVLQTGVVGFVLITALIPLALHRAGRIATRDLGLGAGLLTVPLLSLFYNLLESSFFRTFNIMWVWFLIVSLLLSRLSAEHGPDAQPRRI